MPARQPCLEASITQMRSWSSTRRCACERLWCNFVDVACAVSAVYTDTTTADGKAAHPPGRINIQGLAPFLLSICATTAAVSGLPCMPDTQGHFSLPARHPSRLRSYIFTKETLVSLQVQRWSRQAAEDAAPHEGVGDTTADSDSEQEWPQVHRWSWQAEGVHGPRRGVAGSGSELEWPHGAGQGLQREGSEQVRLGVGVSVACCSLLQTVQGEPASPHVGECHCGDGPQHEPCIAGTLATIGG